MTVGNYDGTLLAAWANEERLAAESGAEAERRHAAEDLDAARGRRPRQSRRGRIIRGMKRPIARVRG
jgi:hypothetical protein